MQEFSERQEEQSDELKDFIKRRNAWRNRHGRIGGGEGGTQTIDLMPSYMHHRDRKHDNKPILSCYV